MKNLTPPKWAPYAIATERGWVHPKTGELLISLKGLKSRIEKEQLDAVVLEIETPTECPVENTFVEITTEDPATAVIEIIAEPSSEGSVATVDPISEEIKESEVIPEKRGRGRPKKNQNES